MTANPSTGGSGIVTHLLHLKFATKGCLDAAVMDRVDELRDAI